MVWRAVAVAAARRHGLAGGLALGVPLVFAVAVPLRMPLRMLFTG